MNARIVVIGALLLVSSIALAYQNEPDGFRGIKWGTRLSVHAKEMTLKEKSKDETYYTRKGDKLELGGAKLTELSYGYWNDQLVSIIMETSGHDDKAALIEAFRKQYGPGSQPAEFSDEYRWRGPTTNINLSCNRGHCTAFLYATQLAAKQKSQKKK